MQPDPPSPFTQKSSRIHSRAIHNRLSYSTLFPPATVSGFFIAIRCRRDFNHDSENVFTRGSYTSLEPSWYENIMTRNKITRIRLQFNLPFFMYDSIYTSPVTSVDIKTFLRFYFENKKITPGGISKSGWQWLANAVVWFTDGRLNGMAKNCRWRSWHCKRRGRGELLYMCISYMYIYIHTR